jgi:uncharacterized protein YgbK (DUF1537 family)
MMKKKIVIITDDFTSAMDNGAGFSEKGLKTAIITDIHHIEKVFNNVDVLVIDTESRLNKKEDAFQKVMKVAKILNNYKIDYIYKTIDSTLRGNIGAEIEALMDTTGRDLCFVAPAYPTNGRTTVGAMQFYHWVPLENTEFSHDPINPVSQSYIPDIISGQTRKKVGVINLRVIMQGIKAISYKIKDLIEEEVEIMVFDAISNENLLNIARTIPLINKPVIIVGSTGWAEHLPEGLEIIKKRKKDSNKRVVVISGSLSDVTRKQIIYASKNNDITIIDINLEKIFSENYEKETTKIANQAMEYMNKGKHVIIRSAKNYESIKLANKSSNEMGFNTFQTSERIALFLGKVAFCICRSMKEKMYGLLLTGGDTALKTIKAMNISQTIVKEEVLPGIPSGYFINEEFKNIRVVVKAGAFGNEDAILRIIEFLIKEGKSEYNE